ncbi:PaaI family thioesterase [Hwanghaeella sp.]|uniref:PaaI family thioesterase n=1 Tax=Hwanghaeella sp. TaxID=2605943 RepID=UPI003CCC400D
MTGGQPTFDPKNPDFETRVRDSFARQPFMAHCNITMPVVAAGYVEMRVDYDRALTQQHGFLHGGLVGTVADCTAGYAAFSLMRAEDSVVTVEYKINMLAPAHGRTMIGRSRVIRAGGSLMVCQSDLYVLSGQEDGASEKHCATALVTLMVLKNTPDAPPE